MGNKDEVVFDNLAAIYFAMIEKSSLLEVDTLDYHGDSVWSIAVPQLEIEDFINVLPFSPDGEPIPGEADEEEIVGDEADDPDGVDEVASCLPSRMVQGLIFYHWWALLPSNVVLSKFPTAEGYRYAVTKVATAAAEQHDLVQLHPNPLMALAAYFGKNPTALAPNGIAGDNE
jgi:hypothetical protein